MKLIAPLASLAVLVFLTLIAQFFGDRAGLHLPWYLLHQIVLGAVPMAWLLWRTMPSADRATRLAFVTTSAAFIALSSVAELMAIENRYWWFFEEQDHLSGLTIGAVPVEEFLFYPLFLNIPVLFYIYLSRHFTSPPAPFAERTKRVLNAVAIALVVAAAGLIVNAVLTTGPALDYAVLPVEDGAGALRYAAGPARHGWTIVQALGLAGTFGMLAATGARADRLRLWLTLAVYFVFAFNVELMACGRGWWVWNSRQVLGLFTWIIPVDSYCMYVTGALMPPLFYEWVRPVFEALPEPKET